MSAVVISGNTSGSITLDAPAVAGSTTLNLPSITGSILAVTAQSLATSGYVTLSNGLIIQWGNGAALTGNTPTTINFPIAFPTGALSFVVTPKYSVSTNDHYIQYTNITTTQVTLLEAGVTDAGYSYIAVGY